MRGIPPIRSRYGPRRRARPDSTRTRATTSTTCTAGCALEVERTANQDGWVAERTMSWLNGCRRLYRRYERTAEHFLAFVGIAGTLICHRRLIG